MPSRKLIIDGKEIEADDAITLLQACEQAGAEIPRFCYHERLSVAGNCRMCLVEWVGAPKPQASCALQVRDICDNMLGKCFCPLGDAATSSIVSSIKLFHDEYLYHIREGHCMVGPGSRATVAARA